MINHFTKINPPINRIVIEAYKAFLNTRSRDSLLNGLHKKGLSKNYCVKVNNLPGGTSQTILEDTDDIIKSKPDCLDVHVGNNDLTR